MIENRKVMSENIQRYLKLSGMSQLDLALKLGVSTATVSYWISTRNYPRIDYIEKMADIFHCSKADLVEDERTVTNAYEITNEEYAVLLAYRNATPDVRRTVMTVLMAMNNSDRLMKYYDYGKKVGNEEA